MSKENQNKELVLIEDLGYLYPKEKSLKKRRYGLYECFCGVEFKTQTANVKIGNTTSCGCNKRKCLENRNTTHNLSKKKLYTTYHHMIQRCTSKIEQYHYSYGKKEITVCDEWKNDFMSFYNWAMANGYQEHFTIDRINNDGNYEPNNCRWVTKTVQARNTRILKSNNTSGYRGVCFNKVAKKFFANISINSKKIHLGYFDTALDAAKSYNKYVIDNNLEHTLNII